MVDGIGGSVKWPVSRRILAAGAVVRTANEVASVAQACHSNVRVFYIPKEEIARKQEVLKERWKKVQTISWTQKFHSVFSNGKGMIKAAKHLVERVRRVYLGDQYSLKCA